VQVVQRIQAVELAPVRDFFLGEQRGKLNERLAKAEGEDTPEPFLALRR
jgi:hypothetical protein